MFFSLKILVIPLSLSLYSIYFTEIWKKIRKNENILREYGYIGRSIQNTGHCT